MGPAGQERRHPARMSDRGSITLPGAMWLLAASCGAGAAGRYHEGPAAGTPARRPALGPRPSEPLALRHAGKSALPQPSPTPDSPPRHPMSESRIPTDALHRWVDELWLAAGCDAREARLTADHWSAPTSPATTRGVGMIPKYVLSWLGDQLQLNQQVSVLHDTGAMLSRTATAAWAGRSPSRRWHWPSAAHEHGVCVMGLRRSHHRTGRPLGRAGQRRRPDLHPLRQRAVQTYRGPAWRLPGPLRHQSLHHRRAGAGRAPLVLDFATSAIALEQVRVAHNKEVPVPPGCLLDAAGHPPRTRA